MVEHTRTKVPLGEYVPTADQMFVMNGVSWDAFETLLEIRGDRSRPKVAYLDGVLELMGTSRSHEQIKSNIGRLVEAYCTDGGIDASAFGSWLLKKRAKDAGSMPDECYVFGPEPGRKRRPDLVIEVIWTSGGIDRLEIYRRLGVGEVWFWQKGKISIHVLGDDGYEEREASACLPALDMELVTSFATVQPMTTAVRKFRQALRR